MSVVGISYTASTGAENINTIEKVQGLTNLVRPLLSLSSVGFALAGKSALGALAAGLVAAGDSRLKTWDQRCVEGFKAALGFTPVVGSFVTLADGAYGMVSKERFGSGAQMSSNEAQSTLVWGGIGLALDGIGLALDGLFHLKRNAVKSALAHLPVPGACTVRLELVGTSSVSQASLDSAPAVRSELKDALRVCDYNPLKGIPGLSTNNLIFLRKMLSDLSSAYVRTKNSPFIFSWMDKLILAIDRNLELRGVASVPKGASFCPFTRNGVNPHILTDLDLAGVSLRNLDEPALLALKSDLQTYADSHGQQNSFNPLIDLIDDILNSREPDNLLDAVA